jgi:arylsulfatase A-like enzyme
MYRSLRHTRAVDLRLAATLALLLLSSCGHGSRRPNLILFSVDTLRPDRLGAYGSDRGATPAIDWLASTGILFENAYSQAPKTAPSHMTLFTGLYPEAHGVENWIEGENPRLSEGVPTLASILAAHGYETRALTGFGHLRPELGFDRGFSDYRSGGDVIALLRGTEQTLEELAARRAAGDDQPFFLFLHTYEVHDPYVAPASYLAPYVDPAYSGRIIGTRIELELRVGSDWAKQHELYWSLVDKESSADLSHLQDLYEAAIAFTDGQIANLIHSLRELDLEDDTIVVFLSDHGEEFGEHGGFLHETLHEEVLRVPLIVKIPGERGDRSRGRRVVETVRLIDVLPTLLELLDLPAPPHLQGESFLPLLEGKPGPDRPVFAQWPHESMASITRGSWKLIQKAEGEASTVELYELTEDSGERHNLAGEEVKKAAGLQGLLREHLQQSRSLRETFPPQKTIPLGAETRRQLEELGYLRRKDGE